MHFVPLISIKKIIYQKYHRERLGKRVEPVKEQ